VHDALGDPLAVELRELLDEVVVVQDDRAVGADDSACASEATGAPEFVVVAGT